MDDQRFDAWTRCLGASPSRRSLMRRALAAGLVASAGGTLGRQRAAADHCDYAGCGCATGTDHPCGDGLICCPVNSGTPGGAGYCTSQDDCDAPPAPCTSDGCECDYHDPNSCDPGLNCCASGASFVCC